MPTEVARSPELHAYVRKSLFWLPRVLGIAFAGFLGVLALDVFNMPLDPAAKAAALFIHVVPPVILLITLALVWHREWVGAVLFPVLALTHLVATWGRLDLTGHLVVELPLLLIGGLFLTCASTRGHASQRTT